jgi:hypothetical protein
MTRPLMQHSINQLEEMFSNSPTDAVILKQLTQELEHRKTPRAAALLSRVQQSIGSDGRGNGAAPAWSPKKSKTSETPNLASLWEAPSQFNSVDSKVTTDTVPAQAPNAILNEPPMSGSSRKPVPKMSVADAYKFLKSAPDTAWVTIEQTRRRLVSSSDPLRSTGQSPEKRMTAQIEAETVNAAYLCIWVARQKQD